MYQNTKRGESCRSEEEEVKSRDEEERKIKYKDSGLEEREQK